MNEKFQTNKDLLKAAQSGNTAAVRTLLDMGARANAKDDKGFTALMLASKEGHAEVVHLLIHNFRLLKNDIDNK